MTKDVNVAIIFHQDMHDIKSIENKRYAAVISQLEKALETKVYLSLDTHLI